MIGALLVAAALGTQAAPAPAGADLEALAREATQAYAAALDQTDRELRTAGFRRAELRFQRLVDAGARNPDLYTDLGNAALQAERLGEAVLAYRRALRLDPDHPRARQNLAHARSLLPAWVPRSDQGGVLDTFFFWHQTLSRSERRLGTGILFLAASLLLATSLRWRQPLARNLSLVLLAGWLTLWASLLWERLGAEGVEVVVTADEVVARAADSALAPSPFAAPLPGGTELTVVERRPPFVRVRLAGGSDAWVIRSSVTPVAPES